jgi:hypothetical protein
MATKRPAKPRISPLQEASDPATAPERLEELAQHKDEAVRQAAWRNPSVPEDVWRAALLWGTDPEPWDNPMAPFYVLTWTPSRDDARTLEAAAQWATSVLWKEPDRCSPEGKAMIVSKVQDWWASSKSAKDMVEFLGFWAEAKGDGSPEHQEVVRVTVPCVRTTPNLTANDQKALDLLEAWSTGGKDRRKEANTLASSVAVKDTVDFSMYSRNNPLFTINKVIIEAVGSDKEGKKREEAFAEHQRLLADVIRREMPLPPVVA